MLVILSSAGIGLLDYLTGWEISFSIFYIAPVSIAAWIISRRAAIVISLSCAVIWFSADITTHPRYSHFAIPLWNAAVRLGFFATISLALCEVRRSLDRQREMSQTDALTGMWNRRAFRDTLRSELRRGRRYTHALSLAYIDLDGFKAINDRLGHHVGDAVLVRVATLIRERVRESDVVARLGGDELAILFPETAAEEGRAAVEKVWAGIRAAMRSEGLPVTVSVGLVTYLIPPEDEETVIQQADRAMYSAKAAGGDRIRQDVFDPPAAAQARRPDGAVKHDGLLESGRL